MAGKCSSRIGAIIALWMSAAVLVLARQAMQYVSPGQGSIQGIPLRVQRLSGVAMQAESSEQSSNAQSEPEVSDRWSRQAMVAVASLGCITACVAGMPQPSEAMSLVPRLANSFTRTNTDSDQLRAGGLALTVGAVLSATRSPSAGGYGANPDGSYAGNVRAAWQHGQGPQPQFTPNSYDSKMNGPTMQASGGASDLYGQRQWSPSTTTPTNIPQTGIMGQTYDSGSPGYGNWTPNRPTPMMNMNDKLSGMASGSLRSCSPNHTQPAMQNEQLGQLYESPYPRNDVYGMRSWSPTRSEAYGTVQKAYLGKVYEVPATEDQSTMYGKNIWSAGPSQSRTGIVKKEYMGKVYEVPASDHNRSDGKNLGHDTITVGSVYESRDCEGNWVPVRVETKNHNGSYTCSLVDELRMFDQVEYWNQVWAVNCREYDSQAARSSRQQQQMAAAAYDTLIPQQRLVTGSGYIMTASG